MNDNHWVFRTRSFGKDRLDGGIEFYSPAVSHSANNIFNVCEGPHSVANAGLGELNIIVTFRWPWMRMAPNKTSIRVKMDEQEIKKYRSTHIMLGENKMKLLHVTTPYEHVF